MTHRLLRDVLGLIFISRQQAGAVVFVGIIGAVTSYGLAWALSSIPELLATVPPTDARFEAVSDAPAWVPPVFFAVYAAIPEEIAYRSIVLVAAAIVAARIRSPWLRAAVVGTVLLGSSFIFGAAHASWSLLNAVHASVSGIVYGSAALFTRSLWAGIIAHALYNAATLIG